MGVCLLCRKLCFIECGSDYSRRGSHLVEPFSLCSAVTVECCIVYPCCVGVCYVCCYVRKKAFLQCFPITEGRDMCLYEVPLSISLLGFGMGTMLTNFHYVLYYVGVLRAVFNMRIQEGLCVSGA